MPTFYFTYGTSGQPFIGGWTEIIAPDKSIACKAFRAFHPDKFDGLLNCSDVYSREEILKTEMYASGNFGARCHEVIIIDRHTTT